MAAKRARKNNEKNRPDRQRKTARLPLCTVPRGLKESLGNRDKGSLSPPDARCHLTAQLPHSCGAGGRNVKRLVGPQAAQMCLFQSALRHEGNKGPALTQPRLDPLDAN